MMNSSQLIQAYTRFREEIENRTPDLSPLDYVDFNVADLTTASLPTYVFSNMRRDFGVNLLNELHEFGRQIIRLDAWAAVLDGYSEEDRLDLLIEFIHPTAVYCLNFPYQVRQRLIYTAAHLLDIPMTFSSGTQSQLPT